MDRTVFSRSDEEDLEDARNNVIASDTYHLSEEEPDEGDAEADRCSTQFLMQKACATSGEDDEDAEDAEESYHASASFEQNHFETNPELEAMREVAASGGGVSGCTTVMMREVPMKYTQRKLLREINLLGFSGQYDFIYLPMDPRKHTNRGFAFINMTSAEAADKFYKTFHGQYLRHFSSEKPLSVVPADLQGFEENAMQYAVVGAPRMKRRGYTKPIFFRPLPPYIAAKIDESTPPPLPPPVQPSTPSTPSTPSMASQSRERPLTYSENDAQERANALLQQALLPIMRVLTQAQPEEVIRERVAMEPPKKFCVYCGSKRLPQHVFCPYCGRQF